MADPDAGKPSKRSSGAGNKKARKKSRFANLSRCGNEAQGVGEGSRSVVFEPPVGYDVAVYDRNLVMTTPGKHKVRGSAAAAEVLRERGFNKSFIDESSDSEGDHPSAHMDVAQPSSSRHVDVAQPSSSRHLEFDQPSSSRHVDVDQPSSSRHLEFDQPSSSAHTGSTTTATSQPSVPEITETSCKTWKTMAHSVFISFGESLGYIIEQINEKRVCSTEECHGILVPWSVQRVGLGGNMKVLFRCTGCEGGGVSFDSSTYVREGRKNVLGHSVALAFILNGCTFEKYKQTLGLGLGIPVFGQDTYYEILKKAYPHIHDLLKQQIEKAKADMKAKDPGTVGSWQRAVTSGDGVYHTRGHHSKNMTVLVVDYLENALLAAVHLCMRGNDLTTEHIPLFKGTAKAAEGYGFELIWDELKNDGISVDVHWQDGDSTSQKSFRQFFSEGKVMFCGGHVGRAHGNQLNKMAGWKTFSKGFEQKHPNYKGLDKLKCHCSGKKHSPTCGCLTPKMMKQAKINHFAALVQSGNDHKLYAKRMTTLGTHHAKNIHSWEGGQCDFHGDLRCTCKKCSPLDVKCEGKPYSTSHPLTCPMHSMAYKIECEERAGKSQDVIHPEMGRGHSNYPEARNNVLIRYRSKSISLNRLAYCTWTDVGLLQGNMTWAYRKYGAGYHWITEVYKSMELPVPEGVVETARKKNQERMKNLETVKTEKAKERRIALKVARVMEQEERKRWNKARAVEHTYGDDSDGDGDGDSEDDAISSGDEDAEASRILSDTAMPSKQKKQVTVVAISRKTCVCGGKDHMRRSSKKCKLYKPKGAKAID